tara:strand:+ start:175 stop:309 length:135 start_codon:yes stop_codon:yes gene_type:complete
MKRPSLPISNNGDLGVVRSAAPSTLNENNSPKEMSRSMNGGLGS